jgi:hypothetical protein
MAGLRTAAARLPLSEPTSVSTSTWTSAWFYFTLNFNLNLNLVLSYLRASPASVERLVSSQEMVLCPGSHP